MKSIVLGQSTFDLFPNANISFNLTERGDYTVALGYYRHIRRPSFWSLNPTVRQVSDYSYSVGIPDLRSSHVDAGSLDFVIADKFTIATGYSETSAKQNMAIKPGVTYNFNSGKGFRAHRIEKNNGRSRLKKE